MQIPDFAALNPGYACWEYLIRDEQDFARHVDYIHWNPVKHGHVERVADWPHSSFHRFVRQVRVAADWAAADLGGSFGEAGDEL